MEGQCECVLGLIEIRVLRRRRVTLAELSAQGGPAGTGHELVGPPLVMPSNGEVRDDRFA